MSDGEGVTVLGPDLAHPSWASGIVGMPGFTASAGLTQIGMPESGETVCVGAATGPVGATVGQIAKLMSWLMGQILRKRMTMRGFIIFQDFGHLYPEFSAAMTDWLAAGKINYREEVIEGLDAAPRAFIGLLRGENFGKRAIHVGPEKMIENKESTT